MKVQKLTALAIVVLGTVTLSNGARAEDSQPVAQPAVPAQPAVAPLGNAVKTQKREAIIDAREANQQKRIEQGVQSGQLNAKEAAHLEKREERIEKLEEKAKADGVITKKEMKRIDAAQDRASRKIFNKKHNGRRG